MGGQHQILRKQLSSEAAFYESRQVGEKERPARPSVDRKHAGLGIALPCPGIGLRMKHGKVHPIPAPAASPITRRPPGTKQVRPRKGRPGGGQPPGMVPVPMGEQHPIELANSEGAKGWLDLGRKGQGAALAPAGSRIHQQAMLRRFHQGRGPLPHVEYGEAEGPGRQTRGWPEQGHHPESRTKTHSQGTRSERHKGQQHGKDQGRPRHRREGQGRPKGWC